MVYYLLSRWKERGWMLTHTYLIKYVVKREEDEFFLFFSEVLIGGKVKTKENEHRRGLWSDKDPSRKCAREKSEEGKTKQDVNNKDGDNFKCLAKILKHPEGLLTDLNTTLHFYSPFSFKTFHLSALSFCHFFFISFYFPTGKLFFKRTLIKNNFELALWVSGNGSQRDC